MVIGAVGFSSGGALVRFPFARRARPRPAARRPEPAGTLSRLDCTDERSSGPGARPADAPRGASDDGHGERGGRRPAGRERLEVTDARIHLPTAREPDIAGYGTFTNETTSTVTVVALDCPTFDRVEVRETVEIGDVPMPRTTRSLTVLPGDGVEFAPGGRRLAMIGPRRPLEAGQLVGITLVFASGRRRVVPFRIVTGA